MTIRSLVAVALALLVAACSDATGIDTAQGRYVLLSINGEPLPFVIIEIVGNRVELSAASIQLNSDGTASSSATATTTVDGVESTTTDRDTGTWVRSGTAVFITWSDGGLEAGTQSGDSLSITSDGFVFLYRR